MLTFVHISCSRSVLHQTIANERSLVGLNKRICEQYDAKLATARRVGTKMAANCVVADLFGLPNGVNDALFSTILVTNINNEQRSTLSSTSQHWHCLVRWVYFMPMSYVSTNYAAGLSTD